MIQRSRRADVKPLVLCVDDEPPVLGALRRALRREPYELITAGGPEEALGILESRFVDLIVADQRMPDKTGTALLREVHRRSPSTIPVMLTGYPDTASIAGRARAGIRRLLTKPWDDEFLKRTLRELLHLPTVPEADVREGVTRVDCAGRTVGEALAQAAPAFGRPAALLLFDLDRLEDSLSAFLKALLRQSLPTGGPVGVVDRSGFAAAMFDALGGPPGLFAYRLPPRRARPRRVLVVEHGDAGRRLLQLLVTAAGGFCRPAATAIDAIRWLRVSPCDLVLLDLDLPCGDAFDVVQHLHEADRRIPVAALSGRLEQWEDETFLRHGIGRRMAKPYSVMEILEALGGPIERR